MTESLKEAKNRLKSSFLGKGGVHGMGISRSQNAIRVYVDTESDAEADSVLAEIRRQAEPYRVIIVKEERPSIA